MFGAMTDTSVSTVLINDDDLRHAASSGVISTCAGIFSLSLRVQFSLLASFEGNLLIGGEPMLIDAWLD